MDEPRARVVGDMIAGKHGDVIVPLAVAVFDGTEGVGEGSLRIVTKANDTNLIIAGDLRLFEDTLR